MGAVMTKATRYIAQTLREQESVNTALRFSAAAAIDALLDVIESSGRKAPAPVVSTGRYWLFAGDSYYASGGMADFVGKFDDLESAKNEGRRRVDSKSEFRSRDADWWHVLDTTTMHILSARPGSYTGSLTEGPLP